MSYTTLSFIFLVSGVLSRFVCFYTFTHLFTYIYIIHPIFSLYSWKRSMQTMQDGCNWDAFAPLKAKMRECCPNICMSAIPQICIFGRNWRQAVCFCTSSLMFLLNQKMVAKQSSFTTAQFPKLWRASRFHHILFRNSLGSELFPVHEAGIGSEPRPCGHELLSLKHGNWCLILSTSLDVWCFHRPFLPDFHRYPISIHQYSYDTYRYIQCIQIHIFCCNQLFPSPPYQHEELHKLARNILLAASGENQTRETCMCRNRNRRRQICNLIY